MLTTAPAKQNRPNGTEDSEKGTEAARKKKKHGNLLNKGKKYFRTSVAKAPLSAYYIAEQLKQLVLIQTLEIERETEMNFSKEMIEKAKNSSSAEELLEVAAKEGIELSAERLEAVVGGKNNGSNYPDPKYHSGDALKVKLAMGPCTVVVLEVLNYSVDRGWNYRVRIIEDGQVVTVYLESPDVTIL